MSYFPMHGMNASTWCSTSNPQGSCKPTKGVCKPMDFDTLSTYKELQNQINRVLQHKGKALIAVTGDIGSKTVEGLNTAMGQTVATTCDQAAAKADDHLKAITFMANTFKLPPPPTPPSATAQRALEFVSSVFSPSPTPGASSGFLLPAVLIGAGAFLYFRKK